MDKLIEFVGNHPYLIGTFVLLIALYVRNEVARGGRGVSAQKLVDMVNRENAIVVDVRDKKDFDEGHIVDAINIPFASLETRIDELRKFRDQPIVVTCKMGQHAGAAGTMLRKNGFANVSRLTGGIMEWRNQSLPVVRA
jgi:rhodanese-related sulfurtransferase